MFEEPTKREINNLIKKAKAKMKAQELNISQLARMLNVNYPNLTRVLNGKLINNPILAKLEEWTRDEK